MRGCFPEKDQASVIFSSRACCVQHFKDSAASPLQVPCRLSRRSFLDVCSRVMRSFVWAEIRAVACGKLASSHPRDRVGGFSPVSDTHQYDSPETLYVCVTITIFFSCFETAKHHSHLRKMELQELPYEVIRFFFLFITALMTVLECLFVNENPKINVKK